MMSEKHRPEDDATEVASDMDEQASLLSMPEEKATNPARSRSKSPKRGNDSRLNPQSPPSPLKRLTSIMLLVFLFWAVFKLSFALLHPKKPKIIYASRYSKEFKFRPAASPIITETLKDGRIRLRGALHEPTSTPSQNTSPVKTKKAHKRKRRR